MKGNTGTKKLIGSLIDLMMRESIHERTNELVERTNERIKIAHLKLRNISFATLKCWQSLKGSHMI